MSQHKHGDDKSDSSSKHSELQESSGQEEKNDKEEKRSLNSQTDVKDDENGGDKKDQDDENKSTEEQNENDGKQKLQEDQEHEMKEDESKEPDESEEEMESPSAEVLSPEAFDSKDFLISLKNLSEKLHADNFKHVDQEFPAGELKLMVGSVTNTLDNFKNYAAYSQQQMESLREQMKTIKDKIYKTVQQKAYDPKAAGQRKSLEERQMENKIAQLNKEVAKAAEEIVRASQISVQTEEAAVQAALAAERAVEDARRIQEEYEARKLAEEERRKAEEERRRLEEETRQAEIERHEQARRAEEARKANLKRDDKKSAEWETWTPATYKLKFSQEFDQGIGCIIRGNPQTFKEGQIQTQAIDQTASTFTCDENEELVSNIIRLTASEPEQKMQKPIHIAIPYCTSRVTALTREPVVKAELDEGTWKTLKSHEVSFDGHKDIKFVQAELETFGTVAVVTRNKLEFLHLSKKGGRAVSSVDPRVTFTVEKGTFPAREHFVLQLQSVDSGTVGDIKKKFPEGKELLSSSALVNMEWTTKQFDMPVTVTLPCPPNPIKAKKAAAMRAAKEAKMRNPLPPGAMGEEEKERKTRRKKLDLQRAIHEASESTTSKPTATKWYMGQYGTEDEDEHDVLYMIMKQANGRWYLVKHIDILQLKLDLLQFNIRESLQRFVVIRTKTVLESKEMQKLAEIIETELKKKHVRVVVEQKKENPTECTLHMVSPAKVEKLLAKLEEEGYEKGQSPVSDVNLNEGDFLEVCFRGNIQCLKMDGKGELVFNSQLQQSVNFHVKEIDKFLQKSYTVYRGFVQLFKRIKIIRKPTKKEESEGKKDPVVDYKRELVSEHLLSIPKEIEIAPPTFVRAPLVLKTSEEVVTANTLRQIANELSEEWQSVGHHLNVKRMRLQAILRNNQYNENADVEVKYDMLMTWAKTVPRRVNKADILKTALILSGRPDLAHDLNCYQAGSDLKIEDSVTDENPSTTNKEAEHNQTNGDLSEDGDT